MKGLILIFQKLFSFIFKFKAIIPVGFVGVFVLSNLMLDMVTIGVPGALLALAKSLFAAETTIHEKVQLAVLNDPSFGFLDIFAIIISVYIIYRLTSLIANHIFINLAGAQSKYGAYGGALLVVFVLEWAVVAGIDRNFAFIPIYHGLIYLIINIRPVITSIHFIGKPVGQYIFSKFRDTSMIKPVNSSINLTRP